MNLENLNNHEVTTDPVLILSKIIEKDGIDPLNTEEVVKVAHLEFGEGRAEHEVVAIIEAYYKKEQDAAAEADRRAE
jgi:hypothetical protein